MGFLVRLYQEIHSRQELLWLLVKRTLKIRYKSSVLGFFWTLLNPLFMILIYLVFIKIMRFNTPLAILLTGIIPWQFLVMSLNDALGIIVGNANLIKKTQFPRIILPMGMLIANLINFLLSLGVLVCFLALLRIPLTYKIVFVPFIVCIHCCFISGLVFIITTLNVFFKDIEHLLGVVLLAWFFVTPLVYPISLVPQIFLSFYMLNPMVGIVELYRSVFLGMPFPGWYPVIAAVSFSVVILWIGLWVFYKGEVYFADEL